MKQPEKSKCCGADIEYLWVGENLETKQARCMKCFQPCIPAPTTGSEPCPPECGFRSMTHYDHKHIATGSELRTATYTNDELKAAARKEGYEEGAKKGRAIAESIAEIDIKYAWKEGAAQKMQEVREKIKSLKNRPDNALMTLAREAQNKILNDFLILLNETEEPNDNK